MTTDRHSIQPMRLHVGVPDICSWTLKKLQAPPELDRWRPLLAE